MTFPLLDAAQRLALLEPPRGPIDMVLDTDTYNEIDDQFSVVYSLLSPERLNVEAIYAAPFHNEKSNGAEDGMQKSYEEIGRVLERLGHSPSELSYRGSTSWMPSVDGAVHSDAAHDLIARARTEREGPLYVVGIGAITNVASAIVLAPDIIERIVVVWLGGHPLYWPHTDEFNLQGDMNASRLLFDCGVPLVHVPCMSVSEQLRVSLPEMERFVRPQGAIGEYLHQIFAEAIGDHPMRTRTIWDIAPIAWLLNAGWAASAVTHSPILSNEKTWSFNPSRHFIRTVNWMNRDAIFDDFFTKLERFAAAR